LLALYSWFIPPSREDTNHMVPSGWKQGRNSSAGLFTGSGRAAGSPQLPFEYDTVQKSFLPVDLLPVKTRLFPSRANTASLA
jgi:hypothetical protein